MDKGDVASLHKGMQVGHKEGGHFAVGGTVDEPRGDYAAMSQRQTNTTRSHSHVGSKRQNKRTDSTTLADTERRLGAIREEQRAGAGGTGDRGQL